MAAARGDACAERWDGATENHRSEGSPGAPPHLAGQLVVRERHHGLGRGVELHTRRRAGSKQVELQSHSAGQAREQAGLGCAPHWERRRRRAKGRPGSKQVGGAPHVGSTAAGGGAVVHPSRGQAAVRQPPAPGPCARRCPPPCPRTSAKPAPASAAAASADANAASPSLPPVLRSAPMSREVPTTVPTTTRATCRVITSAGRQRHRGGRQGGQGAG